jgi:dTDP-4-dehydrorhamnose 3,5-epimerase
MSHDELTSDLTLDRIEPAGVPDARHRAADGTLLNAGVEGVDLVRPPLHIDHRGSLFEAISHGHPFWSEPIVHSEWVVSAPGMIKGWGMHLESIDRYVVGSGRIRVVLYDGRIDSHTHGRIVQFHFGSHSPGWLRIPCGVWHASQNYGTVEAILLNFPTEPHRFDAPDKYRLDPYDRSLIDFDWTLRGG